MGNGVIALALAFLAAREAKRARPRWPGGAILVAAAEGRDLLVSEQAPAPLGARGVGQQRLVLVALVEGLAAVEGPLANVCEVSR